MNNWLRLALLPQRMKRIACAMVLCLLPLLCFSGAAQGQSNSIGPTYFGLTTSNPSSSTCDVYWPLTDGVKIGSLGKGVKTAWSFLQKDSGGTIDYTRLDCYISAAIGPPRVDPPIYTFFQVPNWAVCFDYGSGGKYGGSGGTPCTPAVNNNPITGMNYCPNGTATPPWCPGPTYEQLQNVNGDPTDLDVFAQAIATRYATDDPGNTHYYEIWNEPDTQIYWEYPSLTVNADAKALIVQTYWLEQAVNAGDPHAVFIGPATSSGGAATDTFIDDFLKDCVTISGVKGSVCGASLLTYGSYHMYPYPTLAKMGGACYDPTLTYTTVECTGQDLITSVTNRQYDFTSNSSITQTWMTEGGWQYNSNIIGTPMATDEMAFVGRYELILASLGVHRTEWYEWQGCDLDPGVYGSLYNLSSDSYCTTTGVNPGGTALGVVIGWLTGSTNGSIATTCTAVTYFGVNGCEDKDGSVWMYSVTEPSGTSALAAWVWNNSTVSIPKPFEYRHYIDLTGTTHTIPIISSSVFLTESPILLVP